jgi:hypothetical protein
MLITKRRIFLAIIPIYMLLGLISLLLLFTGNAAMDINGFGVDSQGRMYIGRLHQIDIYVDGEKQDTIQIPKYRVWTFSVQEDDTILLSDAKVAYTMDLSGNIISEADDSSARTYAGLWPRTKITGNDGKLYRVFGLWRTQIVCVENNEVVYQIPFVDIFSRVVFTSGVPILIVSFVMNILKKKKEKKSAQQ